jgi:hypothetical protein
LGIEPYAVPEFIRTIPVMPKNENDKIDRKSVIQWFDEIRRA